MTKKELKDQIKHLTKELAAEKKDFKRRIFLQATITSYTEELKRRK